MSVLALALSGALLFAESASAQSATPVEAGGFRIGELAPQRLLPGSCGLFLWSRSQQPVFILYATDTPAEARMMLDGQTRTLTRATIDGERVLGHFEQQAFIGEGIRFEVVLSYDRERSIQDGAIIKSGLMRARDTAGVETILPVGGMIGCQPSR